MARQACLVPLQVTSIFCFRQPVLPCSSETYNTLDYCRSVLEGSLLPKDRKILHEDPGLVSTVRAERAQSPAADMVAPQAAAGPGGGGGLRTGLVISLPLSSIYTTLFQIRSCRTKHFCCLTEHVETFSDATSGAGGLLTEVVLSENPGLHSFLS